MRRSTCPGSAPSSSTAGLPETARGASAAPTPPSMRCSGPHAAIPRCTGSRRQFVDTPDPGERPVPGRRREHLLRHHGPVRRADRLHRQALREFVLVSQARYWTAGEDARPLQRRLPQRRREAGHPGLFAQVVPDWIWRYYLETGDRALLEQTYRRPGRDTAGYVRRAPRHDRPDPGLVTELCAAAPARTCYGIVDWPAPGRFGYDMTALPAPRSTPSASTCSARSPSSRRPSTAPPPRWRRTAPTPTRSPAG